MRAWSSPSRKAISLLRVILALLGKKSQWIDDVFKGQSKTPLFQFPFLTRKKRPGHLKCAIYICGCFWSWAFVGFDPWVFSSSSIIKNIHTGIPFFEGHFRVNSYIPDKTQQLSGPALARVVFLSFHSFRWNKPWIYCHRWKQLKYGLSEANKYLLLYGQRPTEPRNPLRHLPVLSAAPQLDWRVWSFTNFPITFPNCPISKIRDGQQFSCSNSKTLGLTTGSRAASPVVWSIDSASRNHVFKDDSSLRKLLEDDQEGHSSSSI